MKRKTMMLCLVCGLLGCLCMGAGDWLMIYGDATYNGEVYWIAEGIRSIPQWRFDLSMILAFPGILLYGAGLFAIQNYIPDEKERKIYHYLNAFGMTPWLMLHLFVVMILCLWSYSGDLAAATELRNRLTWVVLAGEVIMLPVFVYWFYLQIHGKTELPRWMAFTNVLIIYMLLRVVLAMIPSGAFRLGYANSLMSQAMFIWFLAMLIHEAFIPHFQSAIG